MTKVKKSAVKKPTAKPTDMPHVPSELKAYALPLASVSPRKDNPRKHDVPKIVELIKAHGFRVPVIVDDNNVIQSGCGRYKAAKQLGMTHIPAIRQSFLSKEAATAFAIIENRSHEWSTWDNDVLQRLLSSGPMEKMLSITGFSSKELSGIKLSSGKMSVGYNLGWLFAAACRASLGILHYGVVSKGKMRVTSLDVTALIDVDLQDGTVVDLNLYRKTNDLYTSIVKEPGTIAADFPIAPAIKDAVAIDLTGDARMAQFCSDDVSRPQLQGCCVDEKDGIMFATDGTWGISRPIPKGKIAISIRPEVWKTIAGTASTHSVAGEWLVSKTNGCTLISRVSSDSIPKYRQVIPPCKDPFVIEPTIVLTAVEALLPFVNPKTNAVRFVDGAVRTMKSEPEGQYEVKCDCGFTGAFNGRALAETLRTAAKLGGGKPCKAWQGASDISGRSISVGEYTILLMPLRVLEDKGKVVYEPLVPESTAQTNTQRIVLHTPVGDVSVSATLGAGVSVSKLREELASGKYSGALV